MERFCQTLFRVCIGQCDAEILGSFDIDARHRCRAFGKIIMELPLAFFFGSRAQVIAGKVVSQQFYIVGQRMSALPPLAGYSTCILMGTMA